MVSRQVSSGLYLTIYNAWSYMYIWPLAHPITPTPPARFRPLALLSISDYFIVFQFVNRRSRILPRALPRDHYDMHWDHIIIGDHVYYRYKIVTATKLLPLQNCYRCCRLTSRVPVRRTGILLVVVI